MKKYALISITLLGCSYQLLASKKLIGRDTTKNNQAVVTMFAPGAIPTQEQVTLSPAFSPDGNSVYFGQISGDKPMAIKVSMYKNSQWSAPQIAPFSGTYSDLEPAFAPDGKYLIFASSRPITVGGGLIDGHYNNAVYAGKGGNLWKVELKKKVWGTPQLLPELININTSVFSPAVAGDNSLYFMRADNGGIFHIYRAQMTNGKYETPVLESYTDKDHGDFDPAVAPDESFIIFSSGRSPAPKTTDLFISFSTPDGKWGELIDLRTALSDKVHGIEARLSPDCKTLYYSNSINAAGLNDPKTRYIWQVDISGLLRAHGIDVDKLASWKPTK